MHRLSVSFQATIRDMIESCIKDKKSDKDESTREYRYITNHGVGPGTLPNNVFVRSEELNSGKTAIYTNRPLTSEELKKYDIKPEWIQESKSNKEICIMCGTDNLNGCYSIKGKPVCNVCGKKYTLNEIEAKIAEVKTESNETLTEAIDKVANNLPKFIYDLTKSDFDKYGETAWSANEPQKTATGITAYEVYRNGKSDYTLKDIEKAVLEHFPELRIFGRSATGKNVYFTKDDKNTRNTLDESNVSDYTLNELSRVLHNAEENELGFTLQISNRDNEDKTKQLNIDSEDFRAIYSALENLKK